MRREFVFSVSKYEILTKNYKKKLKPIKNSRRGYLDNKRSLRTNCTHHYQYTRVCSPISTTSSRITSNVSPRISQIPIYSCRTLAVFYRWFYNLEFLGCRLFCLLCKDWFFRNLFFRGWVRGLACIYICSCLGCFYRYYPFHKCQHLFDTRLCPHNGRFWLAEHGIIFNFLRKLGKKANF